MAVSTYHRLSTALLPQLRLSGSTNGDFVPPKDLKTAASIPLLTVIDNIYFFPLQCESIWSTSVEFSDRYGRTGSYPGLHHSSWSDLFASLDGQVPLTEVDALSTILSTIDSDGSSE
jgi:hypothetical protein